MELDIAHASGCRCSCAGLAVTNTLNAADLVAVVVTTGDHNRVAEIIRGELQREPGVRLLSIECETGRLETLAEGEGPSRRSVLLWECVDQLAAQEPKRFDEVVTALCESMVRPHLRDQRDRHFDRLIMVGGEALLKRLDRIASCAGQGVRYRYILVR